VSLIIGKTKGIFLRALSGRKVAGVNLLTPYESFEGMDPKEKKAVRNRLRRRSSIEPIIGHLKQDHLMGRNLLRPASGDCINPVMAAAAFNFK
jgi:hypothetical protein